MAIPQSKANMAENSNSVKNRSSITVSICSITYNHAAYIRQCLEGMLMQQTSFNYEIIINDDCSTDGTTQILKEYHRKYPDIIKPIYHESNLYSQGQRNFLTKYVFPSAKGKYIAICEGDDYWTDPLKLQKQVEFMESHKDCSLCFHGAEVLNDWNGTSDESSPYSKYLTVGSRRYSADEVLQQLPLVPTCSIMFRGSLKDSIVKNKRFFVGDIIIILSMAEKGELWSIGDCMAVYRRQQNGWVMSQKRNSSKYSARALDNLRAIKESFPCLSKEIVAEKEIRYWIDYIKNLLREKKIINGLFSFAHLCLCYPASICSICFNYIKKK